MQTPGTWIARRATMNQNTPTAAPLLRTADTAPRPSAPIDDAALRDAEPVEPLDKYDPSTIACTD
jgi:hypothetical protein